jgi:tetratricopeptide (TPR) repeat protein
MPIPAFVKRGGSDAAFFLFLALVAVLGFGGSLQYPLAVLRAGGFGAALLFLWNRRKDPVPLGHYPLLVGGFVLLAFGHSFSSVYFWVSFQHALNVALASVLLAWAVLLFRKDSRRTWNATLLAVSALALAEIGIALFQRFHGGVPRPRGTFDNANYLSEFLTAASLLCFSRWLWTDSTRRARLAEVSGGTLFLAAAMFLASSRGVLLASVPAFGVLLVGRFGFRKGGALLAGIGIPSFALLGFRVVERFFGPDLYNYSRWIIWKSALRTFLEHPFGVGLGGFKYFWFASQSPVGDAFRRYGKFATTAHSEYLEVLSGLGGIGLFLFLAVLAYPLFLAMKNRKGIPVDRRPRAAGAAGVLVLSGAHALFNGNFHVFGVFFMDAVMLAMLLSCLPRNPAPPLILPACMRSLGAVVCAALIVTTFATLAGVHFYDRGEKLLRAGDLTGAERAFSVAISADPFRSSYPDALSSVHYRRYLTERASLGKVRKIPESMFETLRWEDRARELSPRDFKYTLRLSHLFFELLRLRGEPSDAMMSLRLADSALRLNPFGVEILWHRADVLLSLGRGEDALKDLEKSVSVEPNFCRGYARLAVFAGKSNQEAASRWSAKEEECRKRAAALHLEDVEAWLVESPEER